MKTFKKSRSKFIACMQYYLYMLFVAIAFFILSLYYAMNGRFGKLGKYKLRSPYLYVWRFFAWGIFVVVVFTFVLVPFFAWWDKMVSFLNYVIWG